MLLFIDASDLQYKLKIKENRNDFTVRTPVFISASKLAGRQRSSFMVLQLLKGSTSNPAPASLVQLRTMTA